MQETPMITTLKKHQNTNGVSVPVEVWWGNEWVKTDGWVEDDNTIFAKLTTRTGDVKMFRVENSKRSTSWRYELSGGTNNQKS